MRKAVEKKRKKKGRPSLLDLQKRTLRLQKHQEEEHQPQQGKRVSSSNPSLNPYLRFLASGTPGRRAARDPAEVERAVEDGDDEEEGSGKRREKKLKLVLRLHQGEDGGGRPGNPQRGRGGGDSSGSESKGEGGIPRKKRKIDAVGGDGSGQDKTERHHSASKATVGTGERSDSGPATPLPDKKLLEFILDRLQKKDTYGVFAEPVDPEELPDYHEVIEHPMDFSTVRKRLSSGYYKSLEMFERDVFLICSNAMSYNAPDTIYFRQARSIQELAKKNFENLRQDSDEEEPEQKIVRRGRPPGKNTTKKAVGRPSDCATSDFASDATLANAGDNMIWPNSSHDLLRKGFTSEKLGSIDALALSNHRLHNSETSMWIAEKSDRNDSTGFVRGTPMRSGKKTSVLDKNRRNTYKQPQSSTSWHESSILTTFDGEKKQLVPVGLHMEHAYARSLARFAANLGPIGWEIAAKQIEQVLPPGTKFGPGWVGEPDIPQQYQLPLLSASPPHPSSSIRMPNSFLSSKGDAVSKQPELPSNNATVEESRLSKPMPATCSSAISSVIPSNPVESAELARGPNYDSGFGLVSAGSISGLGSVRPRVPFQLNQNMALHPGMNGFKTPVGFDMQQAGKMVRPARPMGNYVPELLTTYARALGMDSGGNNSFSRPANAPHLEPARPMGNYVPERLTTFARALGMVSGGDNSFSRPANAPHLEPERPKPGNPGTVHPEGPRGVWKASFLHPEPESVPPPDLNVRFQSPGSPPSRVAVDSQQTDLALQL